LLADSERTQQVHAEALT